MQLPMQRRLFFFFPRKRADLISLSLSINAPLLFYKISAWQFMPPPLSGSNVIMEVLS